MYSPVNWIKVGLANLVIGPARPAHQFPETLLARRLTDQPGNESNSVNMPAESSGYRSTQNFGVVAMLTRSTADKRPFLLGSSYWHHCASSENTSAITFHFVHMHTYILRKQNI